MIKHIRFITKNSGFIHILILGLILGSCNFNLTTIERPVQGVWYQNDLLVAYSTYQTKNPSNPYYYDTDSRNWTYRLEIWPEGNHNNKIILGTFDELPEGGSLQYSRMHWNRDEGVITVSRWFGPYLYRIAGTTLVAHTLNPHDSFYDLIDFQIPKNPDTLLEFSMIDTSLSPDGKTIAILWDWSYFSDPSDPLSDIYTNYILAFYSAQNGSFHYAKRLSKQPPAFVHSDTTSPNYGPLDIELTLTVHDPYPFDSEASNHHHIIWKTDSTSVFLVQLPLKNAETNLITSPGLAVELVFSTGDKPNPAVPDLVPNRSFPTNSGVVNNSGKGVQITASENSFTLGFPQVNNWPSYGDQNFVPLADLAGMSRY